MSKFIEEFYYGNIDPQARSTKKNKTVQKEMAVLIKTEDLLTDSLKDDQKNWFIDFSNAWRIISATSVIIYLYNTYIDLIEISTYK